MVLSKRAFSSARSLASSSNDDSRDIRISADRRRSRALPFDADAISADEAPLPDCSRIRSAGRGRGSAAAVARRRETRASATSAKCASSESSFGACANRSSSSPSIATRSRRSSSAFGDLRKDDDASRRTDTAGASRCGRSLHDGARRSASRHRRRCGRPESPRPLQARRQSGAAVESHSPRAADRPSRSHRAVADRSCHQSLCGRNRRKHGARRLCSAGSTAFTRARSRSPPASSAARRFRSASAEAAVDGCTETRRFESASSRGGRRDSRPCARRCTVRISLARGHHSGHVVRSPDLRCSGSQVASFAHLLRPLSDRQRRGPAGRRCLVRWPAADQVPAQTDHGPAEAGHYVEHGRYEDVTFVAEPNA